MQFEYLSEVMEVASFKKETGTVEVDLSVLNEITNRRGAEGWEFVTHSSVSGTNALIITYRRPK